MPVIAVTRDQNPPLIYPEFTGEHKRLDDVPENGNFIVFTGRTRKVHTFTVRRGKLAVSERFMRNNGFRFDKNLRRWVKNGDKGKGREVVNLN